MSLPNELHPLQLAASSGGGYEIEQSLRFNDSDSAHLSKTTTAGTKTAWTWSCWVKATRFDGTAQVIFGSSPASSLYNDIGFDNGQFRFRQYHSSGGGNSWELKTDARYRDPSAWYHIVLRFDSAQSTSSDRVKIWINGAQVTDFANETYPGQNILSFINSQYEQGIGKLESTFDYYFDGYLSEMHFVDNNVTLTPTDFGEFDNNGVWRPIEYTGSHGTNGYYLKFDPSATNGIGHDHSGNGNNWSPSGFTTSGTGTDVMSDTPTNNWCTLNPVGSTAASQCSNGNLEYYNGTTSSWRSGVSSFAVSSGKWYFEATFTSFPASSGAFVGVGRDTIQWVNNLSHFGQSSAPGSYGYYSGNGNIYDGSGAPTYASTYSTNDLIGCALDLDAGTLHFYKNGVDQGQAASGLTGTWNFGVSSLDTTAVVNFGQREFVYPPGTSSATSYFNTVTYTGNSSTNAITGVGFAPDFVWIKPRSTTDHHRLNDTIRGVNKTLSSNLQNSEYGPVNAYLDSFDSDGFTVSSSDLGWNNSSHTYVAWCWNAGGTTASNTDGSITSSIRANQDAGFSIVTWSGSTANGTVGHGLGTAPGLIIFKRRNATTSWPVYTSILGASQVIYLNETAAKAASGNSFGSSPTDPTSTVFSVGDKGDTNYDDMLAYCWAEKPGVTKIGSYEGNGLASGLSVDVGFRPAMVIIKNADAVEDWNIIDNRTPPNANLRPNSTSAEDSAVTCYLTPTGFTVAAGNRINFANETFIYIAFAENFSADATYKALNTANLPAPTVKDGSDNFQTVLYTGNGSYPRAVTGAGFSPDWVWLKSRSDGYGHGTYDRVRGVGTSATSLRIDTTGPEGSSEVAPYIDMDSLDSDGFTLGNTVSSAELFNLSTKGYVAWCWKADNTSGSSNTDGSITSTVSVNPSAGFSIVTWTASGTNNDTVGHGLGVVPDFMILKSRDGARDWLAYTQKIDGSLDFLRLNTTAAKADSSANVPTSTTFSVYGTDVNTSGEDIIAYCFAEVESYSKFGSYTGNGSDDGPFVYCGFRPAFVMFKKSDNTGNWWMFDTARNEYNYVDKMLAADATSSESNIYIDERIDILSNGFKLRDLNTGLNANTSTFIFMALAEHPFGGSGVSPATAR
jgi:hypothetical protein